MNGIGQATCPPAADWPWSRALWPVASAAFPLAVSCGQLFNPLWGDEAVTVGSFASRSVSTIVTSYPFPNNHIAFSLLLHPLCRIGQQAWLLRLLPLLCTAATLGFLYRLGRQAGGLPAAVCSVVLLGTNQVFLNYTMQLRGYTLSMALMTLLALLLHRQVTAPSIRDRVVIVVAGAAFVYTLPTNITFLLSCGVVAALAGGAAAAQAAESPRPPGTQRLLAAARSALPWGLACGLGAACYLPVWAQLQAVRSEATFSVAATATAYRELLTATFRDLGWLLPAIPLAWFLAVWRRDRRRQQQFSGLVLLTLGPFLMLLLLQVSPFARNVLPLLPLLALALGLSAGDVLRWLAGCVRRIRDPALWAAATGLIGLTLIALPARLTHAARTHARLLTGRPQTVYFRYTGTGFAPQRVTRILTNWALGRRYYVCLFTPRIQFNLGYHLAVSGLPWKFLPEEGPAEPVELLVVASGPPDWPALARISGLSEERLRRLPMREDTGFFQLYVPDAPLPLQEFGGAVNPPRDAGRPSETPRQPH